MANEQNLIPWNQRSKEEQREYARQGGVRSGEVRRQRKAMKEQMSLLLSLPFNLKDRNGNEIKKVLAELGIDEDEIDNQMAMMIALWKTAMGNGRNQVTAFQEIRKVVQDEDIATDDEKVQIINDLPEDDFSEYEEDNNNETS